MNNQISDEIKQRVIKKFNSEINEFRKLSKCYIIRDELEKNKLQLEKQISIASNDASNKISLAIKNVKDAQSEINVLTERFNLLSKEVSTYIAETDKVALEIGDYIHNQQILDHVYEYINIAKKIENISSELHQALVDKDDELSVTLYANLCELSLNLQDSPATHLVVYLRDVIHHWHNHLKNKFGAEFEEVLKAIKWPFVNTNFNLLPSFHDPVTRLQLLSEYLLQIQLPEETARPSVTSALLSNFPPLSLPVLFLIRPLRKRFLFHFYGNKQTNRLDKPEWYMTQILTWIRDHQNFVQQTIQPVIERLALHHVDAKLELMRGLVQLCVEKLHAELPSLAYDDALFSHCVDEALGMNRELRQVYGYPSNQPGPLGPLTHAPVLQKWLLMEKKYALEKMDSMLSSPTAWKLLGTFESEDLNVTECGDSFIALLTTLTERYQLLPQPGHRLQFLDLQIELLDDFRVRLLQLLNDEPNDPMSSKLPHILNTVHYIHTVLNEWSGTVHYIQLHYFKHQFMKFGNNSDSNEVGTDHVEELEHGSVFDEMLSLFDHMRRDLVLTLSDTVVMDVKARSRPYRRDSWFEMPTIRDISKVSLSVTTTACPMFQLLATRLHQLEELLSPHLFSDVWRNIAKQLNMFLFEELILENHFNEGGAVQLNYDMTRNLFPLFAQYTSRPDVHFIHIKEACILLTLSKGSALLLQDALKKANAKEVLKEMGVFKLQPDTALTILNQRIELKFL